MGKVFLDFYNQKIKPVWKTTFFSTFVIGLIVHAYKFTNNLPIHDSLTNYHTSQNMIGSGRWFLSVACAFSSFFDLPWVIGVYTVFLVALTAVVIVDIFKIENGLIGGLIGAILVTFPSLTEIFYFEYTADGYELAMLFAALAVRFSLCKSKRKLNFFLSAVFVCLCCAIYQSYVSFALMLVLSKFVLDLLEQGSEKVKNKGFIFYQIGIYALGLVLFLVIWKILLVVENVPVNHYQGIDTLGFSIKNIFRVLIVPFFYTLEFFSGRSVSVFSILNAVMLGALFVVLILAAKRSGISKNKGKTLLYFLCFLAMPSASYVWLASSSSVAYGTRMLHCLSIYMILFVLLCDRYCRDIFKNIVFVFMIVVVLNQSIMANISYYYLDKSYEATYATALEMISRIDELDEAKDIKTICTVVKNRKSVKSTLGDESVNIRIMSSLISRDLIYDAKRFVRFSNHTFNRDYEFASDEQREAMKNNKEYKKMPYWPSKGSIKVIDKMIVIKLQEPEPSGSQSQKVTEAAAVK